MTLAELEITQASRDRLRILASTLGRAFVTEPIVVWSTGGDPDELAARLTTEFELLDGWLVDHGLLWETGGGQAAALWVPPGSVDLVWQATADISDQLNRLSDDGGTRRRSLWDWIESMIPDEPLWFLDHVGVAPEAQGRGHGGRLVRFGLDRADQDGVPAYLETGSPGNVPFYERFGFRVVAHGDAPDGGPHVWFMRRDP